MKNKRLYVLLALAALALASPCQAQHRRTNGQHNSTPQQALDKRQDAFQGDKAKGVHASYQWELSGPSGGDWWLIVNDGTYITGTAFAAQIGERIAQNRATLAKDLTNS